MSNVRFIFIGLLILILAACGGTPGPTPNPGDTPDPGTGNGSVPTELADSWLMGSLSNIDYYDPHTGNWSDPGGFGIYFIFNRDGSYEQGAVFSSTVYNCTTKVLSYDKGTVEVKGDTLITHLQTGKASWSSTCGDSGENVYGPEDTAWTWSLGTNEHGQETLTLVTKDGSLRGDFQRWSRE